MFDWIEQTAIWDYPDGERTVKVSFSGDIIVRILDEFPLCTESDPTQWDGLIAAHFAYRVEGDPFLAAQSEAWVASEGPLSHYRFITGNGCMDVICAHPPQFEISAPPRAQP